MPMEWLRVSCAAFCRIQYGGRYLFILNQRRATNGALVVTPVGGGLVHHEPAVLRQIGAEPENPGSNELRFYVAMDGASARLDAFRAWFGRRVERELDPFRELCEELVDEQCVLPALSRRDVRFRLARVLEERLTSTRPDARVRETHYFREVFDVELLNAEVERRLLRGSERRGIFWLTPEAAEHGGPLRWGRREVDVCLGHLLRA